MDPWVIGSMGSMDPSPGLGLRLHGPPGVSETSYWDNLCLWTVTRTLTRIMALSSDEKRLLSRSQASPRQVPGRSQAPSKSQPGPRQDQLPARSSAGPRQGSQAQAGPKAAPRQVPGRSQGSFQAGARQGSQGGPRQVPAGSQANPKQVPARSQSETPGTLGNLRKIVRSPCRVPHPSRHHEIPQKKVT